MAITCRRPVWTTREAALMFNIDPSPIIVEKKVDFDIKLMVDNKTGNNFSHMTYLVTITKGGQRIFIESLHTLDGNLKIRIVSTATNPYEITGVDFDYIFIQLQLSLISQSRYLDD